VAKAFDRIAPYHLNNQEIRNSLYEEGLEKEAFRQRLANVIKPVYDSAKNQGFKEWTYHECNHL